MSALPIEREGPRQAPRRHSRARLALARTLERCTSALGGRTWYRRRHLARGRLRQRTEVARVRGLDRDLEGFSIVQLSDLHAGALLGAGDLAHAIERANAAEPDVIALTGDFVTHRVEELRPIAADLARLRARAGIFAVFGNHDYRGRREAEIAAALPHVRFLRNAAARIERGSGAVALVGLEDLEEGRVIDVVAARADLRPGDVEIMLCHNPLGARVLARPGCAAILSGHTHATQVDLPFLRRLGPKHPGARVLLGETLLVVSSGIGAVGLPWRHRAPAEIVRVVLERARS